MHDCFEHLRCFRIWINVSWLGYVLPIGTKFVSDTSLKWLWVAINVHSSPNHDPAVLVQRSNYRLEMIVGIQYSRISQSMGCDIVRTIITSGFIQPLSMKTSLRLMSDLCVSDGKRNKFLVGIWWRGSKAQRLGWGFPFVEFPTAQALKLRDRETLQKVKIHALLSRSFSTLESRPKSKVVEKTVPKHLILGGNQHCDLCQDKMCLKRVKLLHLKELQSI